MERLLYRSGACESRTGFSDQSARITAM